MALHKPLHRIAATDLVAGDTVYLSRSGDWTRDPGAALLVEDGSMADLHLLDAEARAHEVRGAHLAAVAPGA